MRHIGAILIVVAVFLTGGSQAYGRIDMADMMSIRRYAPEYDPELLVYHPANVQGLTGLIVTNSAYTQPKDRFSVSLSGIGENSTTPNFSLLQGIASVTYGATDRIEVGVRAKALAANLGSSATREFGTGDTDFLVKARLTSQTADLPAFAIGLGLTVPTGDQTKGFREVGHEGIRLMLMGTHEMETPDGIVLGLYVEGQLVLIDQLEQKGSSSYQDQYGVINAGLLLPLTESNRLQFIGEVNAVTKKGNVTLGEKDYIAITPGLRYVTPRVNLTAGVQFLNKDQAGATNDARFIATMGFLF